MGLTKYLYVAIICFLIGAIVAWSVFLRPEPGPTPTTIAVNPPPDALKRAETVAKVNHKLTIKQPDKMTANKPQKVPVAVTVKDVATNVTTEAEAVAEAVKTPEGDIVVTLPEIIAADVPRPPPKRNEAGAYYDGGWVAYYKRDLANIGPVSAWAGVSYNFSDNDLTVTVGVAVRW